MEKDLKDFIFKAGIFVCGLTHLYAMLFLIYNECNAFHDKLYKYDYLNIAFICVLFVLVVLVSLYFLIKKLQTLKAYKTILFVVAIIVAIASLVGFGLTCSFCYKNFSTTYEAFLLTLQGMCTLCFVSSTTLAVCVKKVDLRKEENKETK